MVDASDTADLVLFVDAGGFISDERVDFSRLAATTKSNNNNKYSSASNNENKPRRPVVPHASVASLLDCQP
jgi:hypothetical protein